MADGSTQGPSVWPESAAGVKRHVETSACLPPFIGVHRVGAAVPSKNGSWKVLRITSHAELPSEEEPVKSRCFP